jgi:hypothetical protein
MHERDTNEVFTNLFALSRLVTAWEPEPFEIAHLVRFSCAASAREAIWESMQTDCWNEEQLAELQREWESAKFFDGLPDTAELACANMTRMCQNARDESYSVGWGMVLRGVFQQDGFRNLWSAVQGYRQHISYRNSGSYEDEKALLIYFRERQRELKRASAISTWAEMRSLPGATNTVAFKGAEFSRIGTIMNLKRVGLGLQAQGRTMLSRAAETEVQRRLIVTAIALERFALQYKTYPKSLAELVPPFLPGFPSDFMDGKPLRYRRLDDGRYILYSVGLDCVDNGGQMMSPIVLNRSARHAPRFSTRGDSDIVWPLSATQAEIDSFEEENKNQENRRRALPNEDALER